MKKTILIQLNVLAEIDDSELDRQLERVEDNLTGSLENTLLQFKGMNPRWESTRSIVLDGSEMNCGRCAVCNSWVTDREKPNPMLEFSNGAIYQGKLLCDDHLPSDHKWAGARPSN